jgi:hypothetical protein
MNYHQSLFYNDYLNIVTCLSIIIIFKLVNIDKCVCCLGWKHG